MTNTKHKSRDSGDWQLLSDRGVAYIAEISLGQWLEVPDNPRRSDVERRASKEHWKAAERAVGAAAEQLRWVVAGELEGEVFKVDGHVRSHLWQSGKLRAPATVIATVYRCTTREELKDLYSVYDSQTAAETLYDKVTGAYHEHGLQLTSKRLRTGTIVDALHIALRGKQRSNSKSSDEGYDLDLYEAVGFYATELGLLDSVNPQPDTFLTGVVAGALIALAHDPKSIDFFSKLAQKQGSKQNGLNDPIEGILVYVESLKKAKSSWVKGHHVDLAGIVVNAVNIWKKGVESDGYWQRIAVDPIALDSMVEDLRKKRSKLALEGAQ